MLQKSARFAMAVVLSLSLCPLPAFAAGNQNSWSDDIDAMVSSGSYVEGQAIVGIDGGADGQFNPLKLIFGSALDNAENLIEVDAKAVQGVKIASGDTVRIALVSDSSLSTEQLLRKLADDSAVVFAEPNYTIGLAAEDDVDYVEPSSVVGDIDKASVDDFTGRQWAFDTAEGCNPPSWNTASGNMVGEPVGVAVLDSGIDATHPDLADSMYHFTEAQKAQLNCGDYGYDAYAGGGAATGDAIGHGTQVAGVIAAQWNGVGISGIASNADLVSVRVVDGNGSGSIASALRGFDFVEDAIDAGAPISVVNNSWSGPAASRAVDAAVRDLGASYSAMSVFAAGNDGVDLDQYAPIDIANNPYGITVAASDSEGDLWNSSAYGSSSVTLGAPGVGVISTASSAYNGDESDDNFLTTEENGSYIIGSGTSLAASAASGAAAVLAADYRSDSGKLPTAIELTQLVTQHNRYDESAAGKTSTSGVLDLASVSEVTTQAGQEPTITSLSVQSQTISVYGANFGAPSSASTATAYKGGVGDGNQALASQVVSWNDNEIIMTLADAASGIVDVVVTTPYGSARASRFVSQSDEVYPEAQTPLDNAVGPDGQMSKASILKGSGDYLYYLHETPSGPNNTNFATQAFYRYDIQAQSWEQLASLPEWLTYCSAAIFEDNLLVFGVIYDPATGAPTTEEAIFMYSFDSGSSGWVELDATGIPLGAGIVNVNGQLMVVGGADTAWNFSNSVCLYDTDTGIGSESATLAVPVFNPQLVVHEGMIFVYSYGTDIYQFNGTGGTNHLQAVIDSDAKELNVFSQVGTSMGAMNGMPERAQMFGSIAGGIDYLILVGPVSSDGGRDTFYLDWENWENEEFMPAPYRLSDGYVYGASVCVHGDRYYGIGASEIENQHCAFRAAEDVGPAVKEGNWQVWRKGSTDPLTVVFTPDFSRFTDSLYDYVYVDGVELAGDTEYFATMGSTVIDLDPAFLDTLSLGEHELTPYFDGGGSFATAYFTIEGEASQLPDSGSGSGYTRRATLPPAGDILLALPFVLIGVGAVGFGVYLVRRKNRNI